MSNKLDALLAERAKGVKGPKATTKKKLLNVEVSPDIHLAFKRACAAGNIKMRECLNVMIEDFIHKQMMKSKSLKDFQFGTAENTASNEMSEE